MSSKRFKDMTFKISKILLDDIFFCNEKTFDKLRDEFNSLEDENEQLRSLLKDAEEEIEALKESNKGFLESLVEHEAED